MAETTPEIPAAPARPAPSLAAKVATGAAWMVAWRMTSRILGFGSTLVLARVLVPADFGLVAIATAFSQTIDAFSQIGLRSALIRHEEEGKELYNTAFTLQVIRGFLTGAVITATVPFTGAWFGDARLGPILLILAALAVASGFENVGIATIQRDFRFHLEFILQLAPRVLQVAVAVTAALVFRSYWALIAGIAVAKIARLVGTYVVDRFRPRFAFSRWRELADFAFWTWASSLASAAWERSDAFIVGVAFGAQAVGVYLVAAEIATLPLTEFVAPAAAAMFPGFAEAIRNRRESAMSPLSVVVAMSCVFIPVSIAISSNAGPLVSVLLGHEWTAAIPLVAIMTYVCAFSPMSFIGSTVLIARNRVATNFAIVAVSAVVRIALMLMAAHLGRLSDVAFAGLAAVLIESTIFGSRMRRTEGETRTVIAGAVLRMAVAGIVTFVVVWTTPLLRHASLGSVVLDITYGAASGLTIIGLYVALLLALWGVMGRPEGPEMAWARLARAQTAKLLRVTKWRERVS